MKKTTAYIILALSLCSTVFFIAKTSSLGKQLNASEKEQMLLTEKLADYEHLVRVDSMLLNGNYTAAIESYRESIAGKTENKMEIPLRIALAEKLMQHNEQLTQSRISDQPSIDTLKTSGSVATFEIRKYDSLNFTLEKTKVQLARLQRQLRSKSYGEYLKFKSDKGNQLHYVGQVGKGKANGFGIALLDSGSRYEGQWKDNKRHGEGTFYWPDGEYYVGTYNNDKRSGFGTYYWPNGEKYAGEWKEDKRSGSGQFYGTDGDVVADGEWNDDKLVEINKK